MREVFSQSGIHVVEDVLNADEFTALGLWAEQITYRGVHNDRWRSVWRLGDGEPMRGPTWLTPALGNSQQSGMGNACPVELEPLSAILRNMLLNGSRRYARISLTPWIYPQGTALGLHRDDRDFDGSYVFYFSPEWDIHWGGLLNCVIEPPDAEIPQRAVLDPAKERSSMISVGPGIWICPVPNRLVILDAHVRHFITRIDRSAGDRPRLSIAGFIHRNQLG